ncbi:malate dehydrogenase, glyoxysomal [Artemisia annua]|uniref:Malate dehydrogenase, glyoxysomal n=1 Tax=Artemisia annua TaxID=35608 RepID=A0A2U1MT34_ARTAN|nr:malate dehydrogenase, glyoxysomal [Artemisia annua]
MKDEMVKIYEVSYHSQLPLFLFVASACQLAKALEVPLVNDLGYTKRYVRRLQEAAELDEIAGVVTIVLINRIGYVNSQLCFRKALQFQKKFKQTNMHIHRQMAMIADTDPSSKAAGKMIALQRENFFHSPVKMLLRQKMGQDLQLLPWLMLLCAFVDSVVTELSFFASKVRLSRNGIEEVYALGPVNEFERTGLQMAKKELAASIEKSLVYGIQQKQFKDNEKFPKK